MAQVVFGVINDDGSEPGSTSRPVEEPGLAPSDRTYATFIHLTVLAAHAFIPVIPALVMWQIKKRDSPFIADHGKEAVNFQITLVLYAIIGLILSPILIGIPVLVATYVLGIVGMILAVVATNNSRYFRYPMCIRFIR